MDPFCYQINEKFLAQDKSKVSLNDTKNLWSNKTI